VGELLVHGVVSSQLVELSLQLEEALRVFVQVVLFEEIVDEQTQVVAAEQLDELLGLNYSGQLYLVLVVEADPHFALEADDSVAVRA
jgi:hypothetical protein